MLLILLSILIILESLLAIPLPYISKFLIDDVIGKGNYEKTELVFIFFDIFIPSIHRIKILNIFMKGHTSYGKYRTYFKTRRCFY